ncbi:Sodium/glucose cotransporter [Thalassocella blandensis]|nr:Sodium/glucose cotransporter [Thalassocella blandensis]
METGHAQFGWLNWLIVAAFLVFTTRLGRYGKRQCRDLKSFYKANNNVPWWAVSCSLIATKTSSATFIAVPAFIFAASGDLTYLQATIGFALGVFLMLFVFLKQYYAENVFSPYDFIENRLGVKTANLTRIIYALGTMLSQGVRLLLTAVVLSVASGLDTIFCVVIITLFACIWSYMGGITSVIWTDVIQYVIFTLGAGLALVYAVEAIPGGIPQILTIADEKSKLILIDLATDPTKLTLWAAALGCTFFEFSSNAVDHTVTQRTLCCRNLNDARKALAFSSLAVLTSWLMAGVALAMVAYYHLYPMSSAMADSVTQVPDRIFPLFILEQLPVGISGVVVAAIFAAGISTLDSALTALSHTSVLGLGKRYITAWRDADDRTLVAYSKYSIVMWGLIICGIAVLAMPMQQHGLLVLGFKASGVVYGSLMGIALLSLLRKGRFISISIATIIASLCVLVLDFYHINFFWWYPIAAAITVFLTFAIERLFE